MGRSNEFAGGRNGMVEAFHVTPKSNRASIEKYGLIAQGLTTHPDTNKPNFGVFGSTSAAGVTSHAVYGQELPEVISQNSDGYGRVLDWKNRPTGGGDIWKFSVPKEDAKRDTWSPNDKDAIKVKRDISPSNVQRVGHITTNGDVHWHPEEECHN